MGWPTPDGFGIFKNPLAFSVYVENNVEGKLNPPDGFLLMNGQFFLLMNGQNLLLTG